MGGGGAGKGGREGGREEEREGGREAGGREREREMRERWRCEREGGREGEAGKGDGGRERYCERGKMRDGGGRWKEAEGEEAGKRREGGRKGGVAEEGEEKILFIGVTKVREKRRRQSKRETRTLGERGAESLERERGTAECCAQRRARGNESSGGAKEKKWGLKEREQGHG